MDPAHSSSRRQFVRAVAAGGFIAPALLRPGHVSGSESATVNAATPPDTSRGEVLRTDGELLDGGSLLEAARRIPVAGHTDVLVVGGGPAGIGAALGAAKAGASVRLIETAGCLGGI
jgi:NADPH-dependent 2,4-dienoyl-CoA reductase/sulfur reductase-like enzyme